MPLTICLITNCVRSGLGQHEVQLPEQATPKIHHQGGLRWVVTYQGGLRWVVTCQGGLRWVVIYQGGQCWVVTYLGGLRWVVTYQGGLRWVVIYLTIVWANFCSADMENKQRKKERQLSIRRQADQSKQFKIR